MSSKSTILAILNVLLKSVDQNIITSISDDQTTITASNITEANFPNLILITNNPSYNNSYVYLSNISVYLDNNLFPTEIHGLFPIVQEAVQIGDSLGFVQQNTINLPFINGFKNNPSDSTGLTIGQLIDALSLLNISLPDTYGKVKKFTLIFDPDFALKA